jgi:exonuclease I
MAPNEAAATVSMKCRAADDGMGRQIKPWSVIVATREGAFNTNFRSVFERTTVSAMIHDVETKVHKLQFVRERHPAVQQIQMMESESLDFVPAELIDVRLDKVSASSPNPLN